MNIKPFLVEEWMNQYEEGALYNIAETCVDSVSLDGLFALTGEDKGRFLEALCARRLTYGDIFGLPALKEGICKLYRGLSPDQVIPTHGAAGANHHLFYSLVEPGDKVISVIPTYQQLYSIPASMGAQVELLHLTAQNGYLPDLNELERLAETGVKLICINNPNNPTGALMPQSMLEEIVSIARKHSAYILCDEVYRHLTQEDGYCPSIAELYEKGISISSMSKVFSLAGLRLGWIASKDKTVLNECRIHRDYDLISCGMLDEAAASLALKHQDKLLARSRGIVRENLAVLDAWMRGEPHLSYVKPQAGTTALVSYDLDIPSYDFCKELYHTTGAFVTPGACFEEGRSMRIGYACNRETLQKGLHAIHQFLIQKDK